MSAAFVPSYASGQLFSFEDPLQDKPAPDFTLKTLNGKEINLAKYREGGPAIVFFWATWCPHCREQLKDLNVHGSEIEKKGIKLILVDLGEDARQVGAHMKKHNMQYDVLLDTDSAVADKYGIVGVPTFYLIDKTGVVKLIDHAMPENYAEVLLGTAGQDKHSEENGSKAVN